jgi:hypothetical protein
MNIFLIVKKVARWKIWRNSLDGMNSRSPIKIIPLKREEKS